MVEKYYTPKQVAEILQVHPYTILKWIREGRLPALKFGRVYRTTETELTKFLGSTRSHQMPTKNHISTEGRMTSTEGRMTSTEGRMASTEGCISTETSIMHNAHDTQEMHNKEIEGQKMEFQKKRSKDETMKKITKAVPDKREDREEEEQFYILEPPSLT